MNTGKQRMSSLWIHGVHGKARNGRVMVVVAKNLQEQCQELLDRQEIEQVCMQKNYMHFCNPQFPVPVNHYIENLDTWRWGQ